MNPGPPPLRAGRLALVVALAALAAAAILFLALLLDVDLAHGHRLTLRSPALLFEDSRAGFNFRTLHLPRVLAGALVGAGLAAAGCAFQAVLQNPLAEPYTLGVSSGASLGAVVAMRLGLASAAGFGSVGLAALLGAGATVVLVWQLARVGRALPAATILLAGVTVAMFCSAASMLVQYTANLGKVYEMVHWMMGGLDVLAGPLGKSAIAIAVGVAVLLWLARDLNALSAGPEVAASLGVEPRRATALAFGTASLIVGATIALAGPIGFVGLVVPHAVRARTGPDHRVLLPVAMLVGAGFLVACDLVAKLVLPYRELPVGVVTALVGGPFFLVLLVREKRRHGMWG
jgi:iron complex transport system permease protein